MHYCKNEYLVLLDAVNNAIWETVNETTPDVFFYDGPSSRIGNNVLNSGKYFN